MINYIKIDSKVYYPEDGVVLNDKATEELDTLTFKLNNVQQLNLEPFMNVRVVFEDTREKFFVLNTWVDEVATYDGLKNYVITCISETKKLERVTMPNMTITQPLTGDKRTYNRYLEKGLRYVNKIYSNIVITQELYSKIGGEIAVEEQFNTPTAKEYFNSILEKKNAIVKIEHNRMMYFDLAKEGKEIDTSKILFTNNSQTIEDHYSDIVTDVQGVQSEDATIITELVGVRSPENAVLTYDNAVVQLSHNINFLKEVVVWAKVKYQTEEVVRGYRIYGYTNGKKRELVKEKSEYDLLKISNETSNFSDELKRNHLYYVRGNNTIEGLSYNEKTWFASISSPFTAIESIIAKINSENSYEAFFDGDIRDLKFQVTYSAIDDVSTKFEKVTTVKSAVRDNQTDSYVDLDKFAKSQQEKINRLGNPALEINARYYKLADVPELMDKIGDYILAEREVVYHQNYIDFKGVLYKDYVKKNLFYGVNAKKRSTQLIMGNEAVTRKEVIKEKFEFNYEDTTANKNETRYLLGKIVATNFAGDDSTPLMLAGRWKFNDLINTSGGFYLEDGETTVIYGEFYYGNSKANLVHFQRIDIGYKETTSTYQLYYYLDDELKEVFDGLNWLDEKYKLLEVESISHISSTKEGNFHVFLKENAQKQKSLIIDIQPDEYNMSIFDFKPIQIVTCESKLSNGTSLFYKLEPDVRKANKSVTINLKWYDNINVGMRLDGTKTKNLFEAFQGKGGYGQQYVTYTDGNGELDNIVLKMYDGYNYDISIDNFEYVDTYPKYNVGYIDIYKSFYSKEMVVDKDNREILNYTIQFDFSSEEGIYITDRFIDMLPFFKKYKQYLYIWTSNGKYDKYNHNVVLPNSTMQVDNLEISYEDFIEFVEKNNAFNRIVLYNNGVDLRNVNSWALADANGNVYIAVNKRESDSVIPTAIYLNKKGE